MFKLLKILRRGLFFFSNKTALSRRHLVVTYSGELENSKCSSLETKDATELETRKKIYFLCHLTPVDDKNSAGLASFDFRIL